MAVIVYTMPSCVACNATKEWLQRRGIAYEAHSLESSPYARQIAESKGYKAAPIVVAGAASWSGFRPDLIDRHGKLDEKPKE